MVSESGGAAFALRDALELLAATVLTIPLFKKLRLSPILGFLLAGVILGPHGLRLVRDVEDITALADFGVLFLLFEMGLELSLKRLRVLRKYVFGFGTLQMAVTTLILGIGAYVVGGDGVSWQEATVIGGSLSLSSSAFVLRLLQERGEQNSRIGLATFGVLLFQDLAVVPLLVLLPLLSDLGEVAENMGTSSGFWYELQQISEQLGVTVLKAIGGLAGLVVVGGAALRLIFDLVKDSKSPETFTAMVLLTVLGTAWITDHMGLSMTLGAFVSGVLLSESNYRNEISVDVEPFRGMLLGLFFITTGMSADLHVFWQQPLLMGALIMTLLITKSSIATIVGRPFLPSWSEAARVGLLLGQGGEFAFVAFALAKRLGFLPESVNVLLIDVVVASMALTPVLAEVGARLFRSAGTTPTKTATADTNTGAASSALEDNPPATETLPEVLPAPFESDTSGLAATTAPVSIEPSTNGESGDSQARPTAEELKAMIPGDHELSDVVVICGYGLAGRVISRMLAKKFIPYVAVDRDPVVVKRALELGIPCICMDARDVNALHTAGIEAPAAFVITFNGNHFVDTDEFRDVIDALRHEHIECPIFARARNIEERLYLQSIGVQASFPESFETSLILGREVLKAFTRREAEVDAIVTEMRRDERLREEFRQWEMWHDSTDGRTTLSSAMQWPTATSGTDAFDANGKATTGEDTSDARGIEEHPRAG
jgi:monovalent cation:proton antiporter-2 (CPA2) family protein